MEEGNVKKCCLTLFDFLFLPTSPNAADMRRYSANPAFQGRFLFGSHCSGWSFTDERTEQSISNNETLDAMQVATLINNDPNYTPGMPVMLIACLAGCPTHAEPGKPVLAEQVAKNLNELNGKDSPVWGPNGDCHRKGNKTGDLIVSDPNTGEQKQNNIGKWYLPDGTTYNYNSLPR